MADDSRFWRYFHDKLAWGQIFSPGPLSALVKGLAASLDQARLDMILLREQFSPETADTSLIEGFGASRGIIRTRLDTDETYRKRVENAFVWHKLGGKVTGLQQILAENGFLNALILPVNDVRRHDGTLAHNGLFGYGAGLCWAQFNVRLDIPESGLNAEVMTWLRWLVNEYKPARSKLRALSWALPLEDSADCTDAQFLRAATHPVDRKPWGFPLHDGAIRYDNGEFRVHNGKLAHDGKAHYSPWQPSGYRHNAALDAVTLSMRANNTDSVRYAPRHNAVLRYDGTGRRGLLNVPAVDESTTRLAARVADAVKVTEKTAVRASARLRDNAAQAHDGSITHGQRRITIRNGQLFHNGEGLRGQYGGMSFRAVRHDGLADHSGQTLHTLWGWLPESSHAPLFSYRALSDFCVTSLSATASDSFALHDSFTVGAFRYIFHNGKKAHDGEIRYSAKEV